MVDGESERQRVERWLDQMGYGPQMEMVGMRAELEAQILARLQRLGPRGLQQVSWVVTALGLGEEERTRG